MATVPVQIDGVLWDQASKKPYKVTLLGQASIYGLGVGGGPIVPPDGGNGPPSIGGGPIFPPEISGPPGPWPTPPIVIPLPPETPNLPPPGSPPVHIAGTQPVNPMTPPAAVLMEYPGIGKVVVPQPTQSVPAPVPPDPSAPVVTPH
jgi:hypothetical protein